MGTTVFEEIRPGAGSNTGGFAKEKLGGGGGGGTPYNRSLGTRPLGGKEIVLLGLVGMPMLDSSRWRKGTSTLPHPSSSSHAHDTC